jgi:hypothetical protein
VNVIIWLHQNRGLSLLLARLQVSRSSKSTKVLFRGEEGKSRDVKLFEPCLAHTVASADDETVIL